MSPQNCFCPFRNTPHIEFGIYSAPSRSVGHRQISVTGGSQSKLPHSNQGPPLSSCGILPALEDEPRLQGGQLCFLIKKEMKTSAMSSPFNTQAIIGAITPTHRDLSSAGKGVFIYRDASSISCSIWSHEETVNLGMTSQGEKLLFPGS